MSTSSGSPSFLHDDTVSVFYEALSASLREVARIDRPETAPLLVHEGQRKLRGEKVTVPDSTSGKTLFVKEQWGFSA